MVPADGSRGWPQSIQQYNTIYSKHVSQDICKDRASLSIIYTQTAEEAGLSPLLPRSSQGGLSGWGKKVTLVCFYILYIYLLIAPWHLMFTAGLV